MLQENIISTRVKYDEAAGSGACCMIIVNNVAYFECRYTCMIWY